MSSNQKNIIVIMTDQQKAGAINLYGNTICHTPLLESLAKKGVLCRNAYTPHPLCVPARVSLWSSQYPHQHGSRRNETLMKPGLNNAFRLWKQAGYHTALIGKNHCFQDWDRDNTFDTWCEMNHTAIIPRTKGMGWVTPVDEVQKVYDEVKKINPDKVHITPIFSNCKLEHHPTGAIGAQTLQFLRQKKDMPFCLWLSFPHPHEPYIVPTEYGEMFPTEKMELPPDFGLYLEKQPERMQILIRMLHSAKENPAAIKKTMTAYYGNIRLIDDTLSTIVHCLTELGLDENTIIVFCSDHGDFMGELGMTVKGGSFHDSLTRIPLILSGPGIPSGIIEDSFVNLIDLVPTLLHLQDMDIPDTMQGTPIPSICGGIGNNAVFAEYGAGMELMPASILDTVKTEGSSYRSLLKTLRWREAEGRRKMVRTREWKYVHDPKGDGDELYSLIEDPGELKNCINDPNLKDIVCDLRLMLLDWSISVEDSVPVPFPDKIPPT